jgi:hypothetical protein
VFVGAGEGSRRGEGVDCDREGGRHDEFEVELMVRCGLLASATLEIYREMMLDWVSCCCQDWWSGGVGSV